MYILYNLCFSNQNVFDFNFVVMSIKTKRMKINLPLLKYQIKNHTNTDKIKGLISDVNFFFNTKLFFDGKSTSATKVNMQFKHLISKEIKLNNVQTI